jgi:hypothetical protein
MDSTWTVIPKTWAERKGFKLQTSCHNWCLGPDSNRHGVTPRGILSPLRLPVPPPRLGNNLKGFGGLVHDGKKPES